MRLLNTHTLEFEEYFEKDAPPYVILSHRWGAEEVTFPEMSLHRSKRKAGFAKIRGFCRQAVADGFDYAWVDTCCIKKDSSAELSEAINSMFRWYAEAAVCYAYLDDVPGGLPEKAMLDMLRGSKWFTRGWTLQELIAPTAVVFYDADWTKLGTRHSLRSTIASITGIHMLALVSSINTILTRFSVAQKMSWAANRVTTRVEDRAYCLLGIFNVSMPLLYGEKDKAFTRLQEQIINETNDQTIFCWSDANITMSGGKSNSLRYYMNSPTNLLAPSPALFKDCAKISQIPDSNIRDEFKMTKQGLRITGPVYSLKKRDKFVGDGDHLLFLRCYDQGTPNHHLAIMLRQLGDDNFARKNRTLCRIPGTLWTGTDSRMISIRKEKATPASRQILQIGKFLIFHLETTSLRETIHITKCWPPEQWISGENRIHAPSFQDTDISINNWSWHAVILLQVRTKSYAKLRGRKAHSLDCTLTLGYDGIHDRCWSSLRPDTGQDLEAIWEAGVDTSIQDATYTLANSKFDWTIKILLANIPTQEPVIGNLEDEGNQSISDSFIIPVNLEISKTSSKTRNKAITESFSVFDIRLGRLKLARTQSFATLVSRVS